MPVHVLAFGPHPDDIEIGIGGTVALHTAAGYTVGLCDLSAGELGSNGTPGERRAEADAAARTLGAAFRENLGWPDGDLGPAADRVQAAVSAIRRHRPQSIAVPYWSDRHPDHEAASETLRLAAFRSGLRRYDSGEPPWRADWVCYYFINDAAAPSFVLDVSAVYDRKREALACYASQFLPRGTEAVPTRLTAPSFRQLVESRDAQFGALVDVRFAEGFVVREPLERATLLKRA